MMSNKIMTHNFYTSYFKSFPNKYLCVFELERI